jgi:hypothetical protein
MTTAAAAGCFVAITQLSTRTEVVGHQLTSVHAFAAAFPMLAVSAIAQRTHPVPKFGVSKWIIGAFAVIGSLMALWGTVELMWGFDLNAAGVFAITGAVAMYLLQLITWAEEPKASDKRTRPKQEASKAE